MEQPTRETVDYENAVDYQANLLMLIAIAVYARAASLLHAKWTGPRQPATAQPKKQFTLAHALYQAHEEICCSELSICHTKPHTEAEPTEAEMVIHVEELRKLAADTDTELFIETFKMCLQRRSDLEDYNNHPRQARANLYGVLMMAAKILAVSGEYWIVYRSPGNNVTESWCVTPFANQDRKAA